MRRKDDQSTAGDRIAKVTPEDIRRVAAKYFTKSNRVVATLVKPDGGVKETKP